jgi:predicted nucleic acid-binding protein
LTPPVSNFLDTNVLVYAIGDDAKAALAQDLMGEPFILSTQALNEFANVSRRKFGLSWSQIEGLLADISETANTIVSIGPEMTGAALRLADSYKLAFYDALMVAAALSAGCSNYYSEDLHHGLVVEEKLTVMNPFR